MKATPQQPAISSSQTLFAELYRNNTHALLSITFFFLQNYIDTLNCSGYVLSSKGKATKFTCARNTEETSTGTHRPSWNAPRHGNLKMNFDASFIQETKHGSMGAVIRDQSAAVICSMSKQLPNCDDAEEAEARALLQGLQMCVEHGIFPTEVETDCAAVFSAVNETNHNLSKLCFIYREIDRIRKSVFRFSISLVKRDCNTVAHEFARINRVEGTKGFWFETAPSQISPFICDDCNKLVHE